MQNALLLILLLSAVAWPQAAPSPDTAPDDEWQAELDLANRFFQADDYPGAYDHGKKSLEIAQRKHLSPRMPAASEWIMAEALRYQRTFAEAEALHRDALRLRESVLPPTHYRVLQSVQALALTLYAEQKNDEADPLFVRAIAGYNQMGERDGPDECSYGVALADLGEIRLRQRRYDQAEGLMLRATKSWAVIGSECGSLHGLWDKLAALYTIQGQRDKVEPLYQQAIRDLTPEEGERSDPHYAHYMTTLAFLYVGQKRYSEAEPLLKQSLALLQEDPLADKGDLESAATSYIALLKATNRLDEVPPLEQRIDALHHTAVTVAQTPGEKWEALWKLAVQARDQNHWAEAEKGFRDVIAVSESLAPDDLRRVQGYLDLSGLYGRQGRWTDAAAVLKEGIAAAEKKGVRSTVTLTLYTNLANMESLAGNLEASESALRRAVRLREEWGLAPDPMELTGLSGLLRRLGRNEEATQVAQQAVHAGEQEYGPEGMPLSSALEALGLASEAAQKFDEAERAYKRMLALYEKQLGPSHPALGGPLSHLASVYRKVGRVQEAEQTEARKRALTNQPAH